MSAAGGERFVTGHVDVLPGWCYLSVALGPDDVFDDRALALVRYFVDHVLGDQPHRVFADGEWAVVGIGPPDAQAAEKRLAQAFTTELGAVDEVLEEEDGSWN